MVAVLMACSAHLFKLVPLRAAALSAAACISGAMRSITFPLAGLSAACGAHHPVAHSPGVDLAGRGDCTVLGLRSTDGHCRVLGRPAVRRMSVAARALLLTPRTGSS